MLRLPAVGDALCRFGPSLVHVSIRPQDAGEGTALKLQLLVQLHEPQGYENNLSVRRVAGDFFAAARRERPQALVVRGGFGDDWRVCRFGE